MDGWVACSLALLLACALATITAKASWAVAMERKAELERFNPHAWRLGGVVEARMHRRARWVRCDVVAVSWKGGVCVRPCDRPGAKGVWISKDMVGSRVREAER